MTKPTITESQGAVASSGIESPPETLAVQPLKPETAQAVGLTLWEQAQKIAGTEVVPQHLRGKPEAVLAVMAKGRELGIGPMAALKGIVSINGNYTCDGQTMLALSHKVPGADVAVLEENGDHCTVEAIRPGRRPFRVTFSMDDAQRAGLAAKQPWRQYPRAMLRWRAVSEACRFMFADCLAGMYLHEEMGAVVDQEGQMIEPPPAAPSGDEILTAAMKVKPAPEPPKEPAKAPVVTDSREMIRAAGEQLAKSVPGSDAPKVLARLATDADPNWLWTDMEERLRPALSDKSRASYRREVWSAWVLSVDDPSFDLSAALVDLDRKHAKGA